MKVIWKTLESEITQRSMKQHAYVQTISKGGNLRNISLCGKFYQINDEGKPELFELMDGELLVSKNACKTCLKIYNRKELIRKQQ